MGQDQSNQKDLLNEAFNIVQTISPGQYLVRRKKKGDELQLRILTFYLQQQMQDYMRLLDRRKKIKNPHLLELIQHTQINQQNMCSASFKIKTLVEYPFKTIKDQIEERSSFHPKRYFSEDQMWSILYSCSLALHTLYLNKFNHQALNTTQIFIDTSGIIKIADNVLINCEKNHLSILNDNTNQSTVRYISPQLVNLVEDNHFYFYEKEKSDVFILGLIMLQITNLQVVKYYNKKTKKFSFQESCKALAKSQNSYSPQLTQLFQKMLLLDFKVRPRFQDIIRSIQQKTIYTGSSLNSSFQINVEKSFKTALNLKEDSKYLKTLDYQKHDRQWSLPPSNNIYVQQNGNLSHFVSKAQKQYPSITPTDSIFNFQPNYLTTITHPVKSDFQVKKQPNLEVGTKLSSYLPFIDPHINKYRFQPNSENSKIDTVLRNSNKNSDETYTPYMQLLNLTQKTNNANPTKIISNFNANKFQTVVCQPSEKPKISIRFNSSPLKEQKKTEVPTILPAYPATLEGRQSQQFSQVKFGKIQLSNILENVSNNYTVSIGQKVSQLQVRPFEVSSTTSHPGTFTIENYQQGKFQGFKINDKKNGVGRFIYVNGSYYQGEWKDDMMDGFGKLYYPNGQIAYEGHWYYSSFQGTGKLYNEDPKYSTKDPIDYTDLSTVQNRWVTYQGQFQNDEKKGKGTILLANGQTFTGIFVRDMAQGEGCYYKLNGETIKGRWSKNLYIGA